jgi:hypothetical protein
MWYQQLFAQIGPAYDPLFYDVMVYIFGTMLFAVFLLGVIAFWLRRKGLAVAQRKKSGHRSWKGTLSASRSA